MVQNLIKRLSVSWVEEEQYFPVGQEPAARAKVGGLAVGGRWSTDGIRDSARYRVTRESRR